MITTSRLFALLVSFQAMHSIEETVFRLYDWLPHIRWADNVFEGGAFTLFVTVNIAFVTFGAWCYFARVRPMAESALTWIYVWGVIEIANGIGHPLWSLLAQTYVPGTGTAPLLLVTAIALLLVDKPSATGRAENGYNPVPPRF
jgi:hypothetical protein